MVVDHVGVVFFPGTDSFRIIGRIAFPIFCFLLVEGLFHSQNLTKYLLRLGIFAVLSEVIYDWTFSHQFFDKDVQNIFFTLFIGLAAVIGIEKSKALVHNELTTKGQKYLAWGKRLVTTIAIICAALVLSNWLKPAYQYMGLTMILAFYFLRGHFWLLSMAVLAINYWGEGGLQTFAVMAMIAIFFYNGRRGINIKYAFYLFYPLHLLVLSMIAVL